MSTRTFATAVQILSQLTAGCPNSDLKPTDATFTVLMRDSRKLTIQPMTIFYFKQIIGMAEEQTRPSVQEAAPHLHRLLAAMKNAASSPRHTPFSSPSRPASHNASWTSNASAWSPKEQHTKIMASLTAQQPASRRCAPTPTLSPNLPSLCLRPCLLVDTLYIYARYNQL